MRSESARRARDGDQGARISRYATAQAVGGQRQRGKEGAMRHGWWRVLSVLLRDVWGLLAPGVRGGVGWVTR